MSINWFDEHIQLNTTATVVFGIIVIAIVVIAFWLDAKSIAKKKWHCPNCHHIFQKKWTQCLLVIHYGNDHNLRCPNCKKKNFCNESNL